MIAKIDISGKKLEKKFDLGDTIILKIPYVLNGIEGEIPILITIEEE